METWPGTKVGCICRHWVQAKTTVIGIICEVQLGHTEAEDAGLPGRKRLREGAWLGVGPLVSCAAVRPWTSALNSLTFDFLINKVERLAYRETDCSQGLLSSLSPSGKR